MLVDFFVVFATFCSIGLGTEERQGREETGPSLFPTSPANRGFSAPV